jgi:putative hydrolase of the HAD superfamily
MRGIEVRDITTIIFDIGRVLIGIHSDGEQFGALMRAIGIDPREALDRYWSTEEVRRHMTGELGPEDFHRAVAERFGLDYDFASFKKAWCDIFQPMPGMEELFRDLSRRYAIGILSDTDPIHWEYLRGELPWLQAAAKPALSFEVGCLKPHPAMFEAAAANCGTAMPKCLFIDDLSANVEGARHSGMRGLQFINPEKLRKDLIGSGVL